MKKPTAPPTAAGDVSITDVAPDRLIKIMMHNVNVSTDPYMPWDEMRYRTPPGDLTLTEWWIATRLARNGIMRALPLQVESERKLTYGLPDEVLRLLDEVTQRASGQIAAPEEATNSATKDRYVISSLIEEAITSSQLEGASTSRKQAKEMIRRNRRPATRSEQMIMNNYSAMRHVSENRNDKFTPEAICRLHEIVTYKTLDNPECAGKIQADPDPTDRVKVFDSEGNILHNPPSVDELPERLQRLCDFANGGDEDRGVYIPPVVRALAIHFMMGYDHYFEDGNGRTARALFYWSMLKQGYWLSEYLTISRILKQAPSKYTKSFIFTEQDHGDLTYFIIYHLKVIRRALNDLNKYLARKSEEIKNTRALLSETSGEYNYRQLALLEYAIKHPDETFTVRSHAKSHGVSNQSARNDLYTLEYRDLLQRAKIGKEFYWAAPPDLSDRIKGR